MKSMYSASCSTPPMAPDLIFRALRLRQACWSAVGFSLRARISPASTMAASRALERDGRASCAGEVTGSLNVAAWTEATNAIQLGTVVSFILRFRARERRYIVGRSSQFIPSNLPVVPSFTSSHRESGSHSNKRSRQKNSGNGVSLFATQWQEI